MHRRPHLIRPALLVVGALAALASPQARAAVGDDVSAVAKDQLRLRASLRITSMEGYAIHELTAPAGGTVREYVGGSGKIFAVSWSGGLRPDLRDVMGIRYDQYIEARRGQRRARGPVRIELPGMVVAMGSYLRTFWGHVVLTDLAPSGWQETALRGTP
jgi:hypothetical protein